MQESFTQELFAPRIVLQEQVAGEQLQVTWGSALEADPHVVFYRRHASPSHSSSGRPNMS
jgi:hypothetical protein